jgi:hypothetical protein
VYAKSAARAGYSRGVKKYANLSKKTVDICKIL